MRDEISKIFSLEGKVAVVTGGTGILGTEFVKALRLAGAKVAVLDIRKGETNDKSVAFYVVDITKRKEIEAALSKISEKWGVPGVLVNCAAIDVPPDYALRQKGGLLEDDDAEKFYDGIMAVNVKGTILCSQVIGSAMAKQRKGSIINISSIYGEVSPDQRIYSRKGQEKSFIKPIAYCASKAAIPNVTRYLATYFAKSGVRANTLTFGGVFNSQNPEFVEKYSAKVPAGRMADRKDYNGAVVFLASDASSYMTGANVTIDGGYTAW